MVTIERSFRLNQDDDMIERMETDLKAKAAESFVDAGQAANVCGVYSLEDLAELNENDLCRKVAVGVGYAGADPFDSKAPGPSAPGGGTVRQVEFTFHVILAVPNDCGQRYLGTKLLSVLRRRILGKTCDGDITNRAWSFVKEFPDITNSDNKMLYYSQVWRIALPIIG